LDADRRVNVTRSVFTSPKAPPLDPAPTSDTSEFISSIVSSNRRTSRPMRQEERTDRMRQVPEYPNLSPGMERAYSMQQDYEDCDTFADESDPYEQEMTTPAAHREPARFPTSPATRSRDMWNRAQRTPTRAPPSIQRSNDVRRSLGPAIRTPVVEGHWIPLHHVIVEQHSITGETRSRLVPVTEEHPSPARAPNTAIAPQTASYDVMDDSSNEDSNEAHANMAQASYPKLSSKHRVLIDTGCLGYHILSEALKPLITDLRESTTRPKLCGWYTRIASLI
jgi:hypothetical protein